MIISSSHKIRCKTNWSMFWPLQTLFKDSLNIKDLWESGNAPLEVLISDRWELLDCMFLSSLLDVPEMLIDFPDYLCLNLFFKVALRELLITSRSSQKFLDKKPTKLFPAPQPTICLLRKIAFEIPFLSKLTNYIEKHIYTPSEKTFYRSIAHLLFKAKHSKKTWISTNTAWFLTFADHF